MPTTQATKVEATLNALFKDSRLDKIKMMKGAAKSMFRPIQPIDFEHVYLSISSEQGEDLTRLIVQNDIKQVVEFGTSFGISTLYLAQGVSETGGSIITTELIASKANKAIENFKKAGVNDLIEVRIGDAMETLKGHQDPIDLLLLDGWKDLYMPLFNMLEPNFHNDTYIYVDNANMSDSQVFLNSIAKSGKYAIQFMFGGSVALVTYKLK